MHERGGSDAGVEIEPERARTVLAADVEVKPVDWLWDRYLPLGKIAVLEGDPNLAKTTLSLDIAARVTAGLPMPDGSEGLEGVVVFLGYEDDAADTIVPRFRAAGGDAERLVLLEYIMSPEGPRPVSIPEDVEHVERVVRENDARLLIVDPLMAALGIDVKSGVDHHVRRALAPLKDLAERCGCAVLLIRHWNKNQAVSNLLYRGGGSIGIIGAARAGLAVMPDPEDPTRRVLLPIKSNLAPESKRSALRYRVVSDPEYQTARIEWLGSTDTDRLAAEIAQAGAPIDTSAVGEAVAVLREYLAAGPAWADDAKKYMRDAGVTGRTLDRAKRRLGVKARPVGENGRRRWQWSLAHPREERQESPYGA